LLRATKGSDRHPAIGTAEYRRDGDDDHLLEDVSALERAALVLQRGKVFSERALAVDCMHDRYPVRAHKSADYGVFLHQSLKVYRNVLMRLP